MYIGNDLQIAHPSYKIIDDISSSFNGSTTSFALQVSGATPVPFPISTQQVMISVNGVVQEPDPTGSAGFKLLGSNIVFSSAPANGHAFFGVINAGADYVTAGSEFPDGSATAPSFTFQDDQDTGWYRSASGAVNFSSNGVNKVAFDGNGITVSGSCTATSFSGPATQVTVADESSDTTCFPLFATAATGNLAPKSGTNLTFNSSSGALTATSFVGALTGNVTGNASGSSGSCTGNAATATAATTVTVADESSDTTCFPLFATAATGDLGAKSGSNLTFNSSSGALTATSFVGALTGNASGSAATVTGAAQSAITSVGTLTSLTVSGNITVDTNTLHVDAVNNRVGIGTASPQTQLHLVDSANPVIRLEDADDNNYHHIFCDSANFIISADRNDSGSGILIFRVGGTNERMRIDSAGRLLVGTTTEGHADADNLTISDTRAGITIRSANDNFGNIFFSDTTSGSGEYAGYVQYSHTDNYLLFGTNAADQLRIDSSGRVLIGTTTEGEPSADDLTVSTSTDTGITVRSGTSHNGNIYFSDATSGADEYRGYIQYKHSSNSLHLGSDASDTLTLDSSHNATFAGTVSDSVGELRSVPIESASSAQTPNASSAGHAIHISSGGVTINNSVFSTGDVVTIVNNSGSDQTITQGSGLTLYNTADATTGNRTLAGRGMATMWFASASVAYISGAGLS